jgi:hypothetical protein
LYWFIVNYEFVDVADEWNAAQVVRKNTKPVIMIRAGRVIAPIKLQKKAPQNRKGL